MTVDRLAYVLGKIPWTREAAITYSELVDRTGLSRRACERAVEALRAGGAAVCTGDDGIWLTADPDELLDNYRRLRSRALHQLANLRRMRKTANDLRHPLTLWEEVA